MKNRTVIQNIEEYLPDPNDYAFATQISDLPGISEAKIARIVVLYDYVIMHSNKRISLEAEIRHINTSTGEDVTNKFNSRIQDWFITNQFHVYVRDENGNMLPNPEYIKPEDRDENLVYMINQTSEYKVEQAFNHFSSVFKTYDKNNQQFFNTIILIADELTSLFDVYGSLTMKLLEMPVPANLNPDLLELARPSTSSTSRTSKAKKS